MNKEQLKEQLNKTRKELNKKGVFHKNNGNTWTASVIGESYNKVLTRNSLASNLDIFELLSSKEYTDETIIDVIVNDIFPAKEVKVLQESIEKKKLNEGTSNFGHLKYLPLLVFYSLEEFMDIIRNKSDYPVEEMFADENNNIDENAYWDAIEKFEQKCFDENSVCILDEDDIENLENELYDFNKETENIAYEKDLDENNYQKYENNLSLEDIKLEITGGYYEGNYINCDGERYFDVLDEDFKEEQLKRFNDFLKDLKKKYNLTQLGIYARFNNGEVWYDMIKDEEEVEEKPLEESKKLEEAPDEFGILTDDELDELDKKELADLQAKMKARRDELAKDREAAASKKKEEDEKLAALEKAKEEGKKVLAEIEKADGEDFVEKAFNVLVPSSGSAGTLGGELIRAINKIMYRDFNDGDVFYEGYGIETCGAPAAFIAETIPEGEEKLIEIATDALEDDDYTDALKEIADIIEKHIRLNPEILVNKVNVDMYNSDEDFWKEYAPTYETDIEIPGELMSHIDVDNISERDLLDEIEYWEWNDKTREESFSIDWGNTLYIEGLSKEGKDDWERNGYDWLEQYAEQLTDEYGDPNFDIRDEMTVEDIAECFPVETDEDTTRIAAEALYKYIAEGNIWDDLDGNPKDGAISYANDFVAFFADDLRKNGIHYYDEDFEFAGITEEQVKAILRVLGLDASDYYLGDKDDEDEIDAKESLEEPLKEEAKLLKKAVFELDGLKDSYDGYDLGTNWNGWACPIFEKEEALKLIKEVNETPDTPKLYFDEVKDSFIEKDADESNLIEYPGKDYDTEEGKKHLYPVGAFAWIWVKKEEDSLKEDTAKQGEELNDSSMKARLDKFIADKDELKDKKLIKEDDNLDTPTERKAGKELRRNLGKRVRREISLNNENK